MHVAGHAPVQHLVMDRDVKLLILHHLPDLVDNRVALGQISFAGQSLDLGVQIGIAKASAVPAAIFVVTTMDQEVEVFQL